MKAEIKKIYLAVGINCLVVLSALGEGLSSEVLAQRLYYNLAGVKLPLSHPTLAEMAQKIAAKNLYDAAKRAVVVANPGGAEELNQDFTNITLFQFFAPKSMRNQNPDTPLNDFIAMGIANTLYDQPYTQLVQGDFTVEFKRIGSPNWVVSALNQNNLESAFFNPLNGQQQKINKTNLRIRYPQRPGFSDAAGVLTSRQFLSEHGNLGTNRRLVQYAFRNFLCRDITEMRRSGAVAETHITRDLPRMPAGDPRTFLSDCRTCHQVLDPLRKAFAFHDFVNGSPTYASGSVVQKVNRNVEFAGGAIVSDDTWYNFATDNSNQAYFKWEASVGTQGTGAKGLGNLIAQAGAFSECAVEQVWEVVCKKPGRQIPAVLKTQLADRFVMNNHKLKDLFIDVAIRRECLGVEL